MSAAVCAFKDVDGCTNTVIQTIQAGVPIARCDIVCEKTVDAHQQVQENQLPRRADCFFSNFTEQDHPSWNRPKQCRRSRRRTAAWISSGRPRPEERTQLWQARHDAYFACLQIKPGTRAVSTDVCVPISRLAECVSETMADVKNYINPVPLLGHIGDGNFHLMLLVDPDKPEQTELAKTSTSGWSSAR